MTKADSSGIVVYKLYKTTFPSYDSEYLFKYIQTLPNYKYILTFSACVASPSGITSKAFSIVRITQIFVAICGACRRTIFTERSDWTACMIVIALSKVRRKRIRQGYIIILRELIIPGLKFLCPGIEFSGT